MKTIVLFALCVLVAGKPGGNSRTKCRYGFFRNMEREVDDMSGTRRVFGGEAADLNVYPAVAALLDRYWVTKCSGAVISKFWALTAAHCVTSRVAYIKYNTRHPTINEGNHTPVLYLYRHPNYKVVQEDQGRGMDVTLLHHDLGLLRSRDPMILNSPAPPLSSMAKYDPTNLENEVVLVMGFGKTEVSDRLTGEELFSVKLQMVSCDRGAWFHCVCGVANDKNRPSGVCSGDSGGPVVYQGVQVAVTSMGPLECASARTQPEEGAASVFTALYKYVDLINATIMDTENVLRTRAYNKASITILQQHLALLAMFIFTLIA